MTLRSIDRILASSTLCYFCRLRYFSIHPYHFATSVPIIGEYDLFINILPLVINGALRWLCPKLVANSYYTRPPIKIGAHMKIMGM